MRNIYKILGIIVALAVFAVGAATVLAQAQGSGTTPVARQLEQMQNQMFMNRGQMGPMRGQMAGECCGLESPLLDRTVMHTRLADLLGMSLDELEAAMAEGTRLSQLMIEADVDAETVRAAMTEVRETAVAEALADGTITQEQADCVLSKTERGPHMRGLNNHNHENGRQQNHGRMGPRGGN
jgi:hypothetical protein